MQEGTFKFQCIHCNNKLRASAEFIGARIQCPHCKKPLSIPDPNKVVAVKKPMIDMSTITTSTKIAGPGLKLAGVRR